LNAAAAIYVAGLEDSFATALQRAIAALDEGKAAGVLDQFIKAQATA
jgi:anthranilate phosphoribosyltransferase